MRSDARPMPEGFAAVAFSLGLKKLAVRFGAGQRTIMRWRKDLTDPRPKDDGPPADYAEVAPLHSMAGLQRIYGVGDCRIKTWSRITGVEPGLRTKPPRPVPHDFAEVAPTMVHSALVRHYHADWKTVGRWIEETGVAPAIATPNLPPRNYGHKIFKFGGHANQRPLRDMRHFSLYDEAADVLRRERYVVYRCGPTGLFCAKGLHWRVGNVVCTPEDLLARAAKYRRDVA